MLCHYYFSFHKPLRLQCSVLYWWGGGLSITYIFSICAWYNYVASMWVLHLPDWEICSGCNFWVIGLPPLILGMVLLDWGCIMHQYYDNFWVKELHSNNFVSLLSHIAREYSDVVCEFFTYPLFGMMSWWFWVISCHDTCNGEGILYGLYNGIYL